ncbi:branched-chain amino acid ABC transporter substrate-binding protein [Roseibium polysiphoniae]|uniref:Branched-chain amino acid ABC transporter substrate-binding protein n=1 Tax=Roseibium polysiphoniae TaxID=2571221 RepID=A0A944CHF2_9HYPH|nr:branched-chain amino acid ABC transporter substrate-binding protein [Roseibium polysiphoniae]MBS8262729.1 branched-chain amino acid ABC transporter substrate-binding protein [Roseibium polysiphoniae]
MIRTSLRLGARTLAATAIFGAATGSSLADIVIGAAGPMSGQYATFGAQMRAGAEQAIADINAAGGINGEMLILEVGDDSCKPEQAVAIANQMVGKGVVFVAGHFCAGSSIAASSVYADAGIVQISPATTDPKFTDERPGPGIYRIGRRDDQQAEIAGAYLAEAFERQDVAILHDKTAYGKGLADAAKAVMNDAGKTETLYEAFDAGAKDYSGLVSRLKSEGVEAVYLGGYHNEAGHIKRQMTEQGLNAVLITGDALATEEFWSIAGEAVAGTLMTLAPDPRDNAQAMPVIEALEAADKPADGYALFTYAAVQAFAQAAREVGTGDHVALVEALDTGSFSTVLGEVSFDEKGDSTLPGFVWYEWRDGKYDPR